MRICRHDADALVAFLGEIAQFEHVAQHGDALALDGHRCERVQRCLHGVGARIVRVVKHGDACLRVRNLLAAFLRLRSS